MLLLFQSVTCFHFCVLIILLPEMFCYFMLINCLIAVRKPRQIWIFKIKTENNKAEAHQNKEEKTTKKTRVV